jgi:hypothetical protein
MSPSTQTKRRSVSISNYPRGETVDVRLARELKIKPSTAHQLLYNEESGLRRKILAVIRVLSDRPNAFARWWTPVALEVARVRARYDTNQTLDLKAQADAHEAVTRQRWSLTRGCTEMWERALERQIEWCFQAIEKARSKRNT